MAAVPTKQTAAHTDSEGKTWTVARPPTPYIDESGESKGWNELLDHNDWSFRAQQRKPLTSEDLPAFERLVHNPPGVPLPDITFGRNFLQLMLPSMGVDISFNAVDALRSWNQLQHRESLSESGAINRTNYDKHYHTTYTGTINVNDKVKRGLMRKLKLIEAPSFFSLLPSRKRIPVEILRKRGHIFFYDEVPLFEDSLGGKGLVSMTVKIRVMEDCFLVLLRHFVRINGKSVKLTDTRMFHAFAEPSILVDTEVRSASVIELAKLRSSLTRAVADAIAQKAEAHRPFSASVADKAKRDERFYMLPEQIYEILEPRSTDRFAMGTVLA